VVATIEGGSVRIVWKPNGEPDLFGYDVYRGSSADFVPSPSAFLASVTDTQLVDPSPSPSLWYKVVARDVHGNASVPALASLSGPTDVLVSVLDPVFRAGAVDLAWRVSSAMPADVQRHDGGGSWSTLARVLPDGGGMVRWSDVAIRPGAVYAYRLRVFDGDAERFLGDVQVSIPALALALGGISPNPLTGGHALVRFTLDGTTDGRLEVLDVAGRRVFASAVGRLGPGSHTLDLDASHRLSNGVYLVRLTSAGRTLTSRAVLMR
jgi:hypothetical protein